MITIFGEELLPKIKDYDVILFGMGINGAFNQGLLYELALNFPEIKRSENIGSPYGDRRKYGTIFPITIDGKTFCACYMNDGGYNRKNGNLDCVLYEELEKSLYAVKKKYGGKLKIAAPIIGANYYDGKGDKNKILSIFEKVFSDIDIDLYDYDQKDFKKEIFNETNRAYKEYKEGKITKDEYELIKRNLFWKKENGIFKEMPDDYTYKKKRNLLTIKKTDLE